MHPYRTTTCGALRLADAGTQTRLSGWVHRKRDHGQLLFIDLRDHYGITQCVIDVSSPLFKAVDALRLESVISVTGTVVERSAETVNPKLPTGEVEVQIKALEVLSEAETLPFPVNTEADYPEDMRLRYRFLDLRREQVHANIVLRAQVIASIRRRMIEQGFTEFQTPILTASSPEGARDYLVPSRLHPGKFYALPQAPQQFKQLLMVAGFDRYFQIAPCFRDEASRADRSPGEFYQLDFEMSFVTQDDVFAAIEPVIAGIFEEFGGGRAVTKPPFPRIPYAEALAKYGSDKPDLRNPIAMSDVTEIFRGSGFKIFAGQIEADANVRVWAIPGVTGGNRAFCDRMNSWAQGEGQPGLGYIFFRDGEGAGPVARNLGAERTEKLRGDLGLKDGDAVFFVCGVPKIFMQFAAAARLKIGSELKLTKDGVFEFCWITDFPMYELDEETKQIVFSHNPFSMPQGGLEALEPSGSADDQGLPVRHRVQRRRAQLGRDPQPSPGHHVQGVRDRGLHGRGGRGAFRRHAERLQIRRAAAWRLGAGHRPHRHAAGRYAQYPRDRGLPDEPAGPGSADAGAGAGRARALARAAHQAGASARSQAKNLINRSRAREGSRRCRVFPRTWPCRRGARCCLRPRGHRIRRCRSSRAGRWR